MRVLRVFNNNVLMARDGSDREVILTGRGLGFQKKPGDEIDPARVIRTFVPEDGQQPDVIATMAASIVPEHLLLADQALREVWVERGQQPSSMTVLAVADHISFAIKRVRQGIEVEYPLRAEVAHLYPQELAWGERIVAKLNEGLDVRLPSEEAVPLALHIVNASFSSGNLAQTYQMTGVFSQIFEVVERAFDIELDRNSVNLARFITHLRYFFVRVHSHKQLDEKQTSLFGAIRDNYPDAYRCASRVKEVLELRLGQPITEDETTYLTIHIARLTQAD